MRAYESDNPAFDHLINNLESDEIPIQYARPSVAPDPLDEQIAHALQAEGFDESDAWRAAEIALRVVDKEGPRA